MIMKPIAALFEAGAALRAQIKDARGTAAIEAALTCMGLLIFLFGIIEFGFAMWLQSALDYSVAEAARCASVNTTLCDTKSKIESYAASQSGFGFAPSVFTAATPSTVPAASCGNPASPNYYQVSASYPLALPIPTMSVSVTLSAQSCFPS